MLSRLIADKVAALAVKPRSRAFRLVALACGSIVFLALIPAGLIWVGMKVSGVIGWEAPGYIDEFLGGITLGFGLFLVIWAAQTFWTFGGGTPAPPAPTARLVRSGPFSLCRNPIQLGAMFYYFGLGSLWDGLLTGLFVALLGGLLGTAYHKLVEEKELEKRFGEEYRRYKAEVPFIVPRLRRRQSPRQ